VNWLRRAGFGRVLTAANGAAALAVLREEQIDLLITDVLMPVMDGVTLVRRLAKLEKPIPSVVFLSGFGDVDRKEMYGLGVEAFFSKPFDRSELLGVLERALAERSSLWSTPMIGLPRVAVAIEAEGIGKTGETIRLGRGGFSAHYVGLLSLSKVNFLCRLHAQQREMTGQGYVRWNSRELGTIGIEFGFLDPRCRSWLQDEITAGNPRSFIPAF